jgi:DedD protein
MKQRLIGAIVLGCLAIIFLPILLDGEGVSPPEMNIVIPNAPTFPEPLEIEPQRPVVLSDTDGIFIEPQVPSVADEAVEVVDAIAVNTSREDQVNIEELPMLDSEGLPQAWSVRLGLFGDGANAEALITDLLSQNYRAYTDSMPTSQGDLIAVFVGPVVTRNEAESLRVELSNSFNVDALIVDFGINEEN